jgi:hypothetical protein
VPVGARRNQHIRRRHRHAGGASTTCQLAGCRAHLIVDRELRQHALEVAQNPAIVIAVALKDLERALGLFVRALSHESGPVCAAAAGFEREARRLVCEAYATISYAADEQINESPVCLGPIGGSAAVIGRAEAVNAAKDELRERCKKIQNVRVSVPVKDGKGGQVVKMLPLVRVILRELQRLTERETHLALVKERCTNVRANVWFNGLDARNRGRVQVSAELPLLYPFGRSKEIPEIKYPAAAEEGAALASRQRTGKLETEPFLDTLPVYRYRSEYRQGRGR